MTSIVRHLFAFTTLVLLFWIPQARALSLDPSQRTRIDALFAAHDKPNVPGCALGIMSEGRMVYSRGYGQATLQPTVPIDPAKLFDIASMSKQFTAAAIVLLEQQHKLSFTDDVRKYVPELPDYGTPITINHLLWHTSGLRDYVGLLLLAGHGYEEVTTEAQALDLVVRQRKLNFTPGTQWEYSNSGYFLLQLIVRRVSGQSLNDFSRAQVFNPLFMRLAVFRDKYNLFIPNQALGYAPTTGNHYEVTMSNWEQVGDGGLQVSVDELQKWDENFYTGKVGGRPFINEMQRTGTLANGQPFTYARGLQVDNYRGLRRVRHGGDWIGYHANIVRFPNQHTTVALTCNSEVIDQYTLSGDVIDIALEREFTQPKPTFPAPAPSLPLERFVGHYFNAATHEVYPVNIVNGKLTLTYYEYPLTLTSTGPTSFALDLIPGSSVQFALQGDAAATGLAMRFYADEPDYAPKVAGRFTPAVPADLSPYTGRYYSPELGVSWDVAVDNGALTIVNVGGLAPARADAFHGASGYLQFTRSPAGQVTGFKMSYLGMVDFQFDRSTAALARASATAKPLKTLAGGRLQNRKNLVK